MAGHLKGLVIAVTTLTSVIADKLSRTSTSQGSVESSSGGRALLEVVPIELWVIPRHNGRRN